MLLPNCQDIIKDGGQRKRLGIRCLCPTCSGNLRKNTPDMPESDKIKNNSQNKTALMSGFIFYTVAGFSLGFGVFLVAVFLTGAFFTGVFFGCVFLGSLATSFSGFMLSGAEIMTSAS